MQQKAKIEISFMAPAVAGESRHVQKKARGIEEHLNRGECRDEFDFSKSLDVQAGNLQETLLQHRSSSIVHLSAEGTKDGEIVLADNDGHPEIVSGRVVVETLKLLSVGKRAIILDGSYTQQLGRLLQGSVDYVVSMDGAIGPDSAISFVSKLYQALSFGCDFKTAFELGRLQLKIENNSDYSKPVLHEAARPSLDPKSAKFLVKTRKICAAGSV